MTKIAVLAVLTGWLVAGGTVSAERLPDPMRPPQTGSVLAPASVRKPQDWKLHMIRISPDQRLAVINGRIVKPGDEVSGARVVSVEANTVHLRKGAKRFSVALSRASVKRPTAYGGVMMSEAIQSHDGQ